MLIGCTRQPDVDQQGATAEPQRRSGATETDQDAVASNRQTNTSIPDPHGGYVGTKACAECHQQIFDSYSASSHSRSLRRADPSENLAGVTLAHAASKRSYDVVVDNGQLRHVQWEHFVPRGAPLQGSDAKLKLTDLPVEFVMGSGSFAKAYLLRDGDYLLQSPVTWYVADNNYAMAPGYDQPIHLGCSRVIDPGCLFCHVGQVSQQTPQHPQVLELEIGCERCHGPSQKHVAYHQGDGQLGGDKAQAGETQIGTIHPAKLGRVELDSLCAQCHLGGDIVVNLNGQSVWSFRPGQDFAETQLVYRADDGKSNDPFSMHFDQLWNSPCYLESDTLTCTTCHDPHHSEPAGDAADFYRQKCLQCHQDEACGVPRQQRITEQQNQCVKCHMPASSSAAVHSATTNHRIGIHGQADSTPADSAVERVTLRLLQPQPKNLSPGELAIANSMAEAFWLLEYEAEPDKTRGLSASAIEDTLVKLSDDPSAKQLALLARLAAFQAERSGDVDLSRGHFQRAARYAVTALDDSTIDHHARVSALEVLARKQFQFGEYQSAAETYNQLVSLRRSAIDLYNLGLVYGKLQNFGAAEQAFRRAVELDPSYPLPYRSLAKLYQLFKNAQMASQMENIANTLINNQRQ